MKRNELAKMIFAARCAMIISDNGASRGDLPVTYSDIDFEYEATEATYCADEAIGPLNKILAQANMDSVGDEDEEEGPPEQQPEAPPSGGDVKPGGLVKSIDLGSTSVGDDAGNDPSGSRHIKLEE